VRPLTSYFLDQGQEIGCDVTPGWHQGQIKNGEDQDAYPTEGREVVVRASVNENLPLAPVLVLDQ